MTQYFLYNVSSTVELGGGWLCPDEEAAGRCRLS